MLGEWALRMRAPGPASREVCRSQDSLKLQKNFSHSGCGLLRVIFAWLLQVLWASGPGRWGERGFESKRSRVLRGMEASRGRPSTCATPNTEGSLTAKSFDYVLEGIPRATPHKSTPSRQGCHLAPPAPQPPLAHCRCRCSLNTSCRSMLKSIACMVQREQSLQGFANLSAHRLANSATVLSSSFASKHRGSTVLFSERQRTWSDAKG